ncbi:MAG: carboxylating nicotinate-nucleotide diphosphorylase [Planctomycetota bacterium]
MTELTPELIREAVLAALEEDIGNGDRTTEALVPSGLMGRGRIVAKQAGVLAGIDIARCAFELRDPNVTIRSARRDGDRLEPGDEVLELEGSAHGLLTAERVALNFLQRLSGIATTTAAYVDAIKGTGAAILDTRKTTPLLRPFERHAVTMGGGRNHRYGLSDQILIKENHFALSGLGSGTSGIAAGVTRAKELAGGLLVEAEVRDLDELEGALSAGADIILLDNMGPDLLIEAVRRAAGQDPRPELEASGGITLETVAQIAATGVDRISVGALTHSYRSLDLSMYIEASTRL